MLWDNFCLWDKRLKFSLKQKLFHKTWKKKKKTKNSVQYCLLWGKKNVFSNFYLPIIWILIYCVVKKEEEGTWYYDTWLQKSLYKESYLSHTHSSSESSPPPSQFPIQQCKQKTRKEKVDKVTKAISVRHARRGPLSSLWMSHNYWFTLKWVEMSVSDVRPEMSVSEMSF